MWSGGFQFFVFGFLFGECFGAREEWVHNSDAAIVFVGGFDDDPVEFLVTGVGTEQGFSFGDGEFGESRKFGACHFFVGCCVTAEAEQQSSDRARKRVAEPRCEPTVGWAEREQVKER